MSNLIINTTGKPAPNIKDLNALHFRAKTNEDWHKFLNIIKDEFKIDPSTITPKIELPKEDGGRNHKMDGLPKFEYNKDHWQHILIYFVDDKDREKLGKAININISKGDKSLWFPERPKLGDKREYWKSSINKTKYPLYIISKGRYEESLRYTQRHIKEMTDDYYLVVEEDEYELYKQNGVPEKNLLMFSNKSKQFWTTGEYEGHGGSIPVRNFIWQHSKQGGFKRHWCVDDNINGFYRFYENKTTKIKCMAGFRSIEYFADRYNVPMAGMNYMSFCPEISKNRVMIQKNTRIYSIILLDNFANINHMKDEFKDKSYLWRGRYNEDTDLSLRLLKSGRPTALFNTFLANKKTTMTCKGGNTSSIYQGDGLQKKLDSLLEQHPDVVKGTIKFKKVHHQVNYKGYENNIFEDFHPNEKKIDYDLKIYTDETIPENKGRQKQYIEKEPEPEPEIITEEPEPEEKNINNVSKCEMFIKSLGLSEQEKKELIIKILQS